MVWLAEGEVDEVLREAEIDDPLFDFVLRRLIGGGEGCGLLFDAIIDRLAAGQGHERRSEEKQAGVFHKQ